MSHPRALYDLPTHSIIVDALVSASARQITVALLLGIILGLITLFTSPLVALVCMMGLILLAMAFTNPEVVILVVLCFASGLFPERFNPFVSLPVGYAQISDLLLICLFFVVLFRVFTDKFFPYIKTPLDLPILLFFGAVLVGLGTAVLRFGINFSDATYNARMLMYYLIFFAITNLIRTRSQLVRLARGVSSIGLLLAVSIIFQSSLVSSVAPVIEWSPQYGKIVRIFHPGFPLVYIILITFVCHLALCQTERRPLLRWLQILLMGAALFVTVTRNIVVIVVFGWFLISTILSKFERSRLVRNVLGITCIAIVLVSLLVLFGIEHKVVDYSVAFLERLERMFSRDILGPEENLLPRWEEIRFAWAQISKHPILGIGLSNPYRPSSYPGEPLGMQSYIHNAYLSLWLKTGMVGLIFFLWFSVVFLRRGFRRWRNVQDDFLRSVTLGFTIAFVGMMLSNLVAPSMVAPGSIAIFGVALGLNESILLHTERSKEGASESVLPEHHHTTIQG